MKKILILSPILLLFFILGTDITETVKKPADVIKETNEVKASVSVVSPAVREVTEADPVETPAVKAYSESSSQYPESVTNPVQVSIPSIGLNSPVQTVGINSKGEMDVPSGETNNVGWYEAGTVPGNVGSAVFAAHVFAAFSELHKVKVGDLIQVKTKDGALISFKVKEVTTYNLSDVPAERLFNANGGRFLNLITCAGELTDDKSTYTKRLIVYTERI